jgi:hypothetical protein
MQLGGTRFILLLVFDFSPNPATGKPNAKAKWQPLFSYARFLIKMGGRLGQGWFRHRLILR